MKKILSSLIIALCLLIIAATSKAGRQIAHQNLFICDTLPLNDTAEHNNQRSLRKDTFDGLKNMVDSNNLKAKSDSLHNHPPKK